MYPAEGPQNMPHKVQQDKGKPQQCYSYLYIWIIDLILLVAPAHSHSANEVSNKGKCFDISIAMFKSADVNLRPQLEGHPSEALEERQAPGTAPY